MTRIRVTELDKITFLVQSLLVMGPHIQIRDPLSTAVTPPFLPFMSSGKPFADILPPLMPEVLDVLKEMEFARATPVQGAVIPYFLSHKDVNVSACTGSGKTLAFLIPIFQLLGKPECNISNGEVGGIVISPTRELALQTYSIAERFEQHLPKVHVALLTGGTCDGEE